MKKILSMTMILLIALSTFSIFASQVRASFDENLTYENLLGDMQPSWRADGTRIVYVAYADSWVRRIWVMNNDGTNKIQLTTGSVVDTHPTFSPDGTKIAFQRHGFRGDRFDLMIMDADGSNVQRITYGGIPGKIEGSYEAPRWSEDGTKLVFHYNEGTTGGSSAGWWVCTINVDGTGVDVLGRGMDPKFGYGDAKILYSTDPFYEDGHCIALMNADGTGNQILTTGPSDRLPHMSIITNRILFNRNGDLYVMNEDGTNLIPVTSDGTNSFAEWSPDGKYIAYGSNKAGNGDIWKMEAPEPARTIEFSGYEWIVKSSDTPVGPGANYFSDSTENVWVDENDQLHLKITRRDDKWHCAEVYTKKSFGYGKYIFYVASRVDLLDPNVVLGLFTYDYADEPNHREIDIEFSRWGDETNDNSQYVVHPFTEPDNIERFNMELSGDKTSHSFNWLSDSIFFQSLIGHHFSPPNQSDIIRSWPYPGDDNPLPGNEKVHINLRLYDTDKDGFGDPPSDEQEVEVIIKKFVRLPPTEDTEDYIEYVDETIEDLPDEAFDRPEEDVPDSKNDFSDLFEDALENIEEGNYEGAIEKLNRIKQKACEEMIDSTERDELLSMVEDLVAYLETLL